MKTTSRAASVSFVDVSKRYGNVTAVNNISFEVTAGALVTLLGPSGCGKTTTLRLIAGLERASAGQIRIGDQDVTALPATDRDVTMVFQSYALFPHMNVAENVGYGLRVSGIAAADVREQAEEGLRLVGLHGYGERLPSELSGGQQQRVAVARALVLEPQVLLFDEPLSNLDARLRRQVREEIRDIQQGLGLTSVYVTHDQQEALAVSDRIIVMNDAVIAQEGTPAQIYEEPANLFVAGFIGDANVIEGNVTEMADGIAQVTLADVTVPVTGRQNITGPVRVAARPESIRLNRRHGEAALSGIIRKATYLGSHMEYTVDTDLGPLFVIDPDVSAPHSVASDVGVSFANHGITLIQE